MQTKLLIMNTLPASPSYNVDELHRLLKNDTFKIRQCTDEFINVCTECLQLCHQTLATGQYETLRRGFHNLLNLCKYFGVTQLSVLIRELSKQDEAAKHTTLLQIEEELQLVITYFKH